jgi:hypothetical protein
MLSRLIVTLGNADPNDQHLGGRIVAVDDGIIQWLARRERRPVVWDNVAPR